MQGLVQQLGAVSSSTKVGTNGQVCPDELEVVMLRHLEGKHSGGRLAVRRGVEKVGGGIHVPTEFDIGGDQFGDRRWAVGVIYRARRVEDVGNRLDGLAITRLDPYEWHSTRVHRFTGVTPGVLGGRGVLKDK